MSFLCSYVLLQTFFVWIRLMWVPNFFELTYYIFLSESPISCSHCHSIWTSFFCVVILQQNCTFKLSEIMFNDFSRFWIHSERTKVVPLSFVKFLITIFVWYVVCSKFQHFCFVCNFCRTGMYFICGFYVFANIHFFVFEL